MKLSKYAGIVKRRGMCALYNIGDYGVWLGTGASMYCADELPRIEDDAQMRMVLDFKQKDWDKIGFVINDCESLGDVLGLDLRQSSVGQNVKKLPVKAAHHGALFGALVLPNDELIFYDEGLLAPIADRIKDNGYIETIVRRDALNRPYIVVKDGMEIIAAIMPIQILSEQYMEDLTEFFTMCMKQYEAEQMIVECSDERKEDNHA